MSMTAEERKEWAYDRLNGYLRDVEVSEFLGELADVGHLNDRVCDLEYVQEDHGRVLNNLVPRVERAEGKLDSLAS